ncbi:MAG: cutinase family protein [Solirubrobacteraceae bacterium]
MLLVLGGVLATAVLPADAHGPIGSLARAPSGSGGTFDYTSTYTGSYTLLYSFAPPNTTEHGSWNVSYTWNEVTQYQCPNQEGLCDTATTATVSGQNAISVPNAGLHPPFFVTVNPPSETCTINGNGSIIDHSTDGLESYQGQFVPALAWSAPTYSDPSLGVKVTGAGSVCEALTGNQYAADLPIPQGGVSTCQMTASSGSSQSFVSALFSVGPPNGVAYTLYPNPKQLPLELTYGGRLGCTSGSLSVQVSDAAKIRLTSSPLSCSISADEMARAAAGPTKDVVFYSARGSSEAGDGLALGKPALALYDVLKKWAAQAGDVDLYADGDRYPAEDIMEGMRLDIAEHLWLTTHYKASVAEGVSDGVQALEHIASQQDATRRCWSLVLSGYSQGAEVMRTVMARLADQAPDVLAHVAAVVLYGDPFYTADEANVITEGRPFRPSAIGIRRYDWEQLHNGPAPPALAEPTFSWCAPHDLVCGFNNSARRLLLKQSTVGAEEDGHFHYDQVACGAATQVADRLRARGVDLKAGC